MKRNRYYVNLIRFILIISIALAGISYQGCLADSVLYGSSLGTSTGGVKIQHITSRDDLADPSELRRTKKGASSLSEAGGVRTFTRGRLLGCGIAAIILLCGFAFIKGSLFIQRYFIRHNCILIAKYIHLSDGLK